MIWSDYIVFILGVLLILLISVSDSEDDIKDAFSGEKADLFKDKKARGIELFLIRSTFGVAVLFVIMVFVTLLIR